MTVLVVFESHWGNTEQIARSIAAGIEDEGPAVRVASVMDAPTTLDGVELLVAGGPTHAFSMSRESSRLSAVRQGSTTGSAAIGLREYLQALVDHHQHSRIATFDTRVLAARRFPGSAARAAVRLVRREGFAVDHEPESFWVRDSSGPLEEGELDRARRWGHDLAAGLRRLG
ncbi:flavodoxin domain-containing protein [Yonghaparkia sp. Soil809]|uniref:flavodoxin family protein n=1 Tax=Yonghaparkia sp. Soil809 TaxID=1736417 RepID=UPI00070105C2|nr:flavodoxin domain-containing protein [Yonghaparkia sp. Soil809]KRF31462.1 hypothetical protein ASG83_11885 [Yonghaparkia sp. Soil809]